MVNASKCDKGTGKVTIVEVAAEAGVSFGTVSRVINNDIHVKPETRERVLATMRRLHFVANPQARSLAGGRSNTIGVLVPDLGTGYIGEIMRGIDARIGTGRVRPGSLYNSSCSQQRG